MSKQQITHAYRHGFQDGLAKRRKYNPYRRMSSAWYSYEDGYVDSIKDRKGKTNDDGIQVCL